MKTVITLLCSVIAALFLGGCASIENNIRRVPSFAFKSWSHSDRYGVFTDNLVLSGAKWTLNPDGSATLVLDHYDGNAAWAGTVGPHDAIEGLVVTFPANSPQAAALKGAQAISAP